MKGKFHTEEDCYKALGRKGIVFDKTIVDGVPVQEMKVSGFKEIGNKSCGRIDFMRKQGWTLIKKGEMFTSEEIAHQKRVKNAEKQSKNMAVKMLNSLFSGPKDPKKRIKRSGLKS